MKPMPLKPGDVLQLSEVAPYPYNFLTVLSERNGGAEGVVLLPTQRGVPPTQTRLFVPFAQCEFIGTAAWFGGAAEPNRRTLVPGDTVGGRFVVTERVNPKLTFGDVVQIAPGNSFFGTAYMVCTEIKAWGAQGYIPMPDNPGELPGLAYYRARWEEMEYIGHAVWTVQRDEEETDDNLTGGR